MTLAVTDLRSSKCEMASVRVSVGKRVTPARRPPEELAGDRPKNRRAPTQKLDRQPLLLNLSLNGGGCVVAVSLGADLTYLVLEVMVRSARTLRRPTCYWRYVVLDSVNYLASEPVWFLFFSPCVCVLSLVGWHRSGMPRSVLSVRGFPLRVSLQPGTLVLSTMATVQQLGEYVSERIRQLAKSRDHFLGGGVFRSSSSRNATLLQTCCTSPHCTGNTTRISPSRWVRPLERATWTSRVQAAVSLPFQPPSTV